jgi:hypothetical protein
MHPLLRAATLVIVAAAIACGDDGRPTLQLVTNGGFETGDLTGWTDSVIDGFGNAVGVYVTNAATGPASSHPIPAPASGTYGALFDQNGEAQHIVYQDIAIPAGYTSAAFTASIYLNNEHSDYVIAPTGGLAVQPVSAEPNQQFRIDVMSPAAPVDGVGAGVLRNLYQTMPGDPLTNNIVVTDDLAAFAGQTIRLRFAAAVGEMFFQVGIDAVQVSAN